VVLNYTDFYNSDQSMLSTSITISSEQIKHYHIQYNAAEFLLKLIFMFLCLSFVCAVCTLIMMIFSFNNNSAVVMDVTVFIVSWLQLICTVCTFCINKIPFWLFPISLMNWKKIILDELKNLPKNNPWLIEFFFSFWLFQRKLSFWLFPISLIN